MTGTGRARTNNGSHRCAGEPSTRDAIGRFFHIQQCLSFQKKRAKGLEHRIHFSGNRYGILTQSRTHHGKKGREDKAVAYLRTSSAANVGSDKDSDQRQREAIGRYARATGSSLSGSSSMRRSLAQTPSKRDRVRRPARHNRGQWRSHGDSGRRPAAGADLIAKAGYAAADQAGVSGVLHRQRR